MHTASELLITFTDHLKLLNRSPATIKAYREHLEIFFDSVREQDMRMVSRAKVESWIVGLYDHRTPSGKPYSTSTLCLKIRSVKRFFEFLESSNTIFINPAERIREPKLDRRLPKQIPTPDEIKRLLDRPDLTTPAGIRDRTIMEVFYSTGIRKEELCNLTIYDADLSGHVIWIKGKGDKDRVVPLGKYAVRYLQEYITKARSELTKTDKTGNDHLFVDIHGKPIDKQSVNARIRKHARDAGITKRVGSHMFRHAFAMGLIRNGADITSVQRMLGHSNLETTEVYIRSLGLDLKESHTNTHPREQDRVDRQTVTPDIERIIPHAHQH